MRYVKKYNPLIHNQSTLKQPANNILVTHVFHFRYMENGYCKRFLSHALQILKNKYHQVTPGNVLPWQVYTPKDFKLHSGKLSEKTTGN